jgi:hypothetical protein
MCWLVRGGGVFVRSSGWRGGSVDEGSQTSVEGKRGWVSSRQGLQNGSGGGSSQEPSFTSAKRYSVWLDYVERATKVCRGG